MNWRVPFFELNLTNNEINRVVETLKSNWLTSGPNVKKFEEQFSTAMGDVKFESIAVTNGTAALHLSLAALNISLGDEVLCPTLTFVACANTIRMTGANPIFLDIQSSDNWNLCPCDAEKKITDKTKAIMVVHYAGYPCDMEGIVKLANKYNLKIIEDCSHAPVVKWRGQSLGTIGDIGCFSFFSNKNITTGEGGMVVTKDHQLANKIRRLRSHGMSSTTYERYKGYSFEYDVDIPGFNYRIDEIRAAIGVEQLKRIEFINSTRKEKTRIYRQLLDEIVPEVKYPFSEFFEDSGYHIFPVLLPEGRAKRSDVMKKMAERGVQTSIHYKPIHKLGAYSEYDNELPVIDSIENRILTLPFYHNIKTNDVNYVVEALRSCIQ